MDISLAQVKQIIDPALARLLLEAVMCGYNDYYEKVSDEDQAIGSAIHRAIYINDHMLFHARAKIQGYPGVRFITRRGRDHLLINELVEIKLKKLNCNHLSSNVSTKEVQRYNTQIPLPIAITDPEQLGFPGMLNPIANLILGYHERRRKSDVAAYIVCPLGSRNRWEWELDFVSETAVPQPVEVPLTPKAVVPKNKLVRGQTDQRGAYGESSGTIQS